MDHEVIRMLGERFDAMERNAAQRFESLERSNGQRFDAIDGRLDGLTDQVKRTNGQVQSHAQYIAGVKPVVEALQNDRKPYTTLGGENRQITKWDVLLVLGTIVATFSTLKMLGVLR